MKKRLAVTLVAITAALVLAGTSLFTSIAHAQEATVSVRIVDPDGKPVVRQILEARVQYKDGGGREVISDLRSGTTDDDGKVTISVKNSWTQVQHGYDKVAIRLTHVEYAIPLDSPAHKGVKLAKDKSHDFGTVDLAKGGHMQVGFKSNVKSDRYPFEAIVRPLGHDNRFAQRRLRLTATGKSTDALAPGQYVLTHGGDHFLYEPHTLEIRSTETTNTGELEATMLSRVKVDLSLSNDLKPEWKASAEMIEGRIPCLPDDPHWEIVNDRLVRHYVIHDATGPSDREMKLFPGKWRVTVTFRGNTATKEFDVPTDEVVKLEFEGADVPGLDISVLGHDDAAVPGVSLILCPHTADQYSLAKNQKPRELIASNDLYRFQKWVGAQGGYTQNYQTPGTYSVLAVHDGWVVAAEHGIKVTQTDRTEVKLRVTPIIFNVHVTRKGKPVANAELFLAGPGVESRTTTPLDTSTGADGTAQIKLQRPGVYAVLTQRERDWLDDSVIPSDYPWALRRFGAAYLVPGSVHTRAIELEDPNEPWVRLKLKLGAGLPDLHSVSATPLSEPDDGRLSSVRLYGSSSGDHTYVDLGPLAPGRWGLGAWFDTSPTCTELEINATPFQEIHWSIDAASATFSIPDLPDPKLDRSAFIVMLIPDAGAYSAFGHATAPIDEEGIAVFETIPSGRYRVGVFNPKVQGPFAYAQIINIEGEYEHEVVFDPKAGAISVSFGSTRADTGKGDLFVLDAKGNEVVTLYRLAFGSFIPALPAGRYTIRFSGIGHEDAEAKVTVKAGEITKVEFKLKPALASANISFEKLSDAEVHAIFDGIVVERSPGRAATLGHWHRGGGWQVSHVWDPFTVHSIPLNIKHLRVKLRGLEDMVFSLTLKPGTHAKLHGKLALKK